MQRLQPLTPDVKLTTLQAVPCRWLINRDDLHITYVYAVHEVAKPIVPQLQPLPSDAQLLALPPSQRPEPRAFFARPFDWHYQV